LANVVISRNWISPNYERVVWKNAAGVTIDANTITKSAGLAWGNAGAISTKSLYSGDGYVQATAVGTDTYPIFGLSHGDASKSWEDIDFALYPMANGTLRVYERGVFRGTFGTYYSGDKLRVAVVNRTVKYYRNGILLYTSTATPVYPLLVDTALYTPGAVLGEVVISRTFQ